MERVLWALAAYGILRVVLDVVGVFHLRRLRRKHAQEEEIERRKMETIKKRQRRMRELLSNMRRLLDAHIFDGQETETINIELLTLLDEVLADEGPDEFYQWWRNELIQRVADNPGGGN